MKFYETVQESVNVHGELHLDKVRTKMLIEMIKRFELYCEEFGRIAVTLEQITMDMGFSKESKK